MRDGYGVGKQTTLAKDVHGFGFECIGLSKEGCDL